MGRSGCIPKGGGTGDRCLPCKWGRGVWRFNGSFILLLAPLPVISGGVTKLGLTKFEAKIGQGNEPSIRMFQKLHFEQVRLMGRPRLGVGLVVLELRSNLAGPALWLMQVAVSSVFREVTLRLTVSESERQWLLDHTSHVEEKAYRDGSAEH